MNTKIIVALVIGIALVGLTGAASAQNVNDVTQYSKQCSTLIGVNNFAGQGQTQIAGITGGNGNVVDQFCFQDADAFGGNNDILQGTEQLACLYSDDSYAGQLSEQGANVVGLSNLASQFVGETIIMGGHDNSAIQLNDQTIDIGGAWNTVVQGGQQTATVAPFDFGSWNVAFQNATQSACVVGLDNVVGQGYLQGTVLMGVGNIDIQTVNQEVTITP